MIRSGAIAVLSKRHIQYTVKAILNPPMATHGGRYAFHLRRQTADVITRTGVRFTLGVDMFSRDHHHTLQAFPPFQLGKVRRYFQHRKDVISPNFFVFMGKYQSIDRINYESILNDFDRLLPLYQYIEGHVQNGPTSVPVETNFAFRPGCRTKKRSAIVRRCRDQIEKDLRHNALQKALYRRLAREFGKDCVGTEITGKNGTSIDVVLQRKHTYWFYEIKTAPTARACIREALGQILEYAFWPGAQEAVRLIIAAECEIDKEAEDYLCCLKQRFSLPLSYQQIKM